MISKVDNGTLNPAENGSSSVMRTVESVRLGGEELRTINDADFAFIRSVFNVPETFAESREAFKFENMAAAGGKGGDPMAFTNDRKYIVKQLNKGDHNMLAILSKPLAAHFKHNSNSLLCPVLFHLAGKFNNRHAKDKNHETYYVVMLNCLHPAGVLLYSKNTLKMKDDDFLKVYDLKGCADDKLLRENGKKVPEVHKRFFKFHMWFASLCYCDAKQLEMRQRYFKGKLEALHNPYIPLGMELKKEVIECLKRDIEFLKRFKLMDYSLLVGVAETQKMFNEGKVSISDLYKPSNINGKVKAGLPLFSRDMTVIDANATTNKDEPNRVILLSIIDYFQTWTPAKVAARGIKSFECNKATVPPDTYGDRFVHHFEEYILPSDVEATERTRFEQNLRTVDQSMPFRCFPLLKK